jgi:hypothetical protein
MDVGIFKAGKIRMALWIVVPPVLIVSVGLSSYAMQQRAEWRLQETKALSDVLPDVVNAKQDVKKLYDNLGLSREKRITTGDQLIGILEEKARLHGVDVKKTQILDREIAKGSKIPVISVIVDASGSFADFQLFLNDVKSAHPLVSARTITLQQGDESERKAGFDLRVVFDLLLVNDVLKASGGTL